MVNMQPLFWVCKGLVGVLRGGVALLETRNKQFLILSNSYDGICVKKRFCLIFKEVAKSTKSTILDLNKGVWWEKLGVCDFLTKGFLRSRYFLNFDGSFFDRRWHFLRFPCTF